MKTRYLTAIIFTLIIIFFFEGIVFGCGCDWWTRPDLCHECIDGVWVNTCVGCESCDDFTNPLFPTCVDDDNNCGGLTPYCVNGECVECKSNLNCVIDECCLNFSCVKKCNPNGETCSWTYPEISGPVSHCISPDPTDLSCSPADEGFFCGWKETVFYLYSDTNAACVSNSILILDGFCVKLEPMECKNIFILNLGLVCSCEEKEGLVYLEWCGFHYTCTIYEP